MTPLEEFAGRLPSLVGEVWDAMLAPGEQLDSGAACDDRADYSARIDIWGTWRGTLYVGCHERVARKAAEGLFARDAASLSHAEVLDALCEFANLLGGNAKAMLASGCQLGLPHAGTEDSGPSKPAPGNIVCETRLSWRGCLLHVCLLAVATGPNFVAQAP
ncbi:MAG: chemotaxis protein CheX [Planctomycetes bacterium]|nr:chemotaxis protein CheX [Planctomycetota bacterium]